MKVIVKATKKQLHESGICSKATFDWLLDGQPKEVKNDGFSAAGRRFFFLKHPDDTETCSLYVWVWEDQTEVLDEEEIQTFDPSSKNDVEIKGVKKSPLKILPDTESKIGVEAHLDGGIRGLNEALGLPKFHHRDDGGQLGLVNCEGENGHIENTNKQ